MSSHIGYYKKIDVNKYPIIIQNLKHEVSNGKSIDVVLIKIGRLGVFSANWEIIPQMHIYYISYESMNMLYELISNVQERYDERFKRIIYDLTKEYVSRVKHLISVNLACSLIPRCVIDHKIHSKVLDHLEKNFGACLLSRSDILPHNHLILKQNYANNGYDLYAGADFLEQIVIPRQIIDSNIQLRIDNIVDGYVPTIAKKPRKRNREKAKEKEKAIETVKRVRSYIAIDKYTIL
jgi:hypothetical protein